MHTSALRFSADGKWIVTAAMAGDAVVQLWDAATGATVGPPMHFGMDSLECPVFSPQGDRLAGVTRRGRLLIWEPHTGKILREAHHDTWTTALAFSPDGKRIALGGTANVHQQDPHFTASRVYDVETGNPITPLLEHESGQIFNGTMHSFAFSDNSRYLVSRSSYGRSARVWDLSKGGLLVVQLDHPSHVLEALFDRDGKVITACADGAIRIWELPREMVTK